MVGTTPAQELYQRVIRDLLKSCPGVVNIVDDIIMHGATVEEQVLNRLFESGLTLYGKICT